VPVIYCELTVRLVVSIGTEALLFTTSWLWDVVVYIRVYDKWRRSVIICDTDKSVIFIEIYKYLKKHWTKWIMTTPLVSSPNNLPVKISVDI
jgi:hypothetical protein